MGDCRATGVNNAACSAWWGGMQTAVLVLAVCGLRMSRERHASGAVALIQRDAGL